MSVAQSDSRPGPESFLNRDMKKTMLKLAILRRSSKEKVYPYAIVKEFSERRHGAGLFDDGKDIKNGVYNTIKVLENSGYIHLSGQKFGSRAKNYYAITRKGRLVLDSTRRVLAESMKELSSIVG